MRSLIKLDEEQVRRFRLMAQRLTFLPGEAAWDPVQAAHALGGVQAQDIQAAGLSLRLRSPGLTKMAVDQARLEDASLGWTWTLRGTLHLHDARDLPWIVRLLGPRTIAGSRSRYRQLELDEASLERGSRLIRSAIGKRGPLTRAELKEVLEGAGISAEGQRLPHIIAYTALQGLICRGPELDGETAYALVSEWIKEQAAPSDPLAELARRHLGTFAPAGVADLATWSGLSQGEARRGLEAIAGETLEVEAAAGRVWILRDQQAWVDEVIQMDKAAPQVRLLPYFDTFLLGYASREWMAEPAHWKRVNRGGGMLNPTILVDGRIVGLWKLQKLRKGVQIILSPTGGIEPAWMPGLQAEAADIGRYFGQDVELNIEEEQ